MSKKINCVNCGDQELTAYLPVGAKHSAIKKEYQGYHIQCKKCSRIKLLVPGSFKKDGEYESIIKTIVDASKPKDKKEE